MRVPLGRIAWAAASAALLTLEVHGIRKPNCNNTMSEFTRYAFRTHTPAGKAAFVLAWAGLTIWFIPHVLTEECNGQVLDA